MSGNIWDVSINITIANIPIKIPKAVPIRGNKSRYFLKAKVR
ncbi:hypothetical protein SPLC1_S530590 [Arthrospira platensis C1]|uniref:Uncharacterized protein n=1 Tax=Limnospira indica PCC 8005 TaxID=376219 RepID=A0A9P1NZ30_9CYAN|nr:hypothetical protein SPLC1_S530590 [Arthrospira platensis C1]CDM95468.1 conserved protein of unknown function [Limnospira indica PCC 8005]CDM95948.1 conserved protein of unknown function [Limnospira indica PCC 8005]